MKFIYQSNANLPGIYKIINTHTNRIYIGQSSRFKKRWADHQKGLLNGNHRNKFLLNDFKKCKEELGHDDFLEFHVLEVMEGSTKEERNLKEEEWIAKFWDKQALCYNFKQKADSKERSCFSKTPEETRKKISEATKASLATPEAKKKMRAARLGKPGPTKGMVLGPCSEETRQKISKANKGQTPVLKGKTLIELIGKERAAILRDEQRSRNTGKTHSEETRLKISRFNKGKTGLQHNRTKIYKELNLLSPNGTLYTEISCMNEFCSQHSLNPSLLRSVINGKRNHHQGWKIIS